MKIIFPYHGSNTCHGRKEKNRHPEMNVRMALEIAIFIRFGLFIFKSTYNAATIIVKRIKLVLKTQIIASFLDCGYQCGDGSSTALVSHSRN